MGKNAESCRYSGEFFWETPKVASSLFVEHEGLFRAVTVIDLLSKAKQVYEIVSEKFL